MNKFKDKVLEFLVRIVGTALSLLFFAATIFVSFLIPILIFKWVMGW